MNTLTSSLFTLNWSDLVKGAVTAAIAGVLWSIGSAFHQSGFDIFVANWHLIFNSAINAGLAAFVGYLGKNFLTDENGKVLGRIG